METQKTLNSQRNLEKEKWKGLRGKEYTNQFSLQSKGAVTVEDYWTECQCYDIV